MAFMLLNLIPPAWRAGLSIFFVLAVLGALAGAYAYVRHQAYSDGYSRAEAECEQEKAAQVAANRKAMQEAEKRLLAAADALSVKNMEMDNAIDALAAAAAADPNGTLECLGVDSLFRLNTIR